ncbi:hypothetical protein SAMN06265355_102807 [Actinomadura mexicana]|uniref:Uncharacterized protein n=2 Tax=Actinomadura mexicana TaxID=134959 RepID=A0A238W7U0_9ACTN|nr:hypothetical protein [Actinomadura mexicana]SNR42636.1 hypothetical protein SAMN06265355_102807 [Actinomadura mexicana]
MMHSVKAAVILAAKDDPNTQQLADWLRNIFGPLFLVIVGIVALFFLFTREITRFIQFIVLSIVIAVVFYYPGIITSVAEGIVQALGVEDNG